MLGFTRSVWIRAFLGACIVVPTAYVLVVVAIIAGQS